MQNIVSPTFLKFKPDQAKNLAVEAEDALKHFYDPWGLGQWGTDRKGKTGPFRLYTKATRRRLYAALQAGRMKIKADPCVRVLQDRIEDGTKCYYTSGHCGFCLVRFEIDAHHGETDVADCYLALEPVIGRWAYSRKSTRGHQLHVKVCRECSKEEYNRKLAEMDQHLFAYGRGQGFRAKYEVQGGINIHGGKDVRLAQMPPILNYHDLDEFKDCPVVDFEALYSAVMRLPAPTLSTREKAEKTSTYAIPIAEEYIDRKDEVFASLRQHAYYLMDQRQECARKLTYTDFLTALFVLNIAHEYRQEDGALPGTYIKYVWTTLYARGVVQNYYHDTKWKALRDTLSKCGFLTWHSNKYWFFPDEEKKKGQCMRWELQEEYCLLGAEKESPTGDIGHISDTYIPFGRFFTLPRLCWQGFDPADLYKHPPPGVAEYDPEAIMAA